MTKQELQTKYSLKTLGVTPGSIRITVRPNETNISFNNGTYLQSLSSRYLISRNWGGDVWQTS